MEILKTLRHEYKYVIAYEDMLKLRSKLDALLTIDRENNGYMVRSLYLDSIDDIDYYDKLGGEVNRKKIRLRIYELDNDYVKLEVKAKYDIHQLKRSLIISKDIAKELIKENYDVLLESNNELAKEIYVILKSSLYKPKVIIEYTRIAYVTNTNTRITFDLNIKSSSNINSFFDKNINYNNLTNANKVVLEVKFDRYLEPYIANILANYQSQNQSISKYVMGRNEL